MPIKKELSKDTRIKKEERRLKKIYSQLEDERKNVANGLIPRAAYMLITLEDMEKDLDENGYVEMFSQSDKTEPYERERPVARQYQQMNKNYQSICKQLADLLPKNEKGNGNKGENDDGFDSFVNSRD